MEFHTRVKLAGQLKVGQHLNMIQKCLLIFCNLWDKKVEIALTHPHVAQRQKTGNIISHVTFICNKRQIGHTRMNKAYHLAPDRKWSSVRFIYKICNIMPKVSYFFNLRGKVYTLLTNSLTEKYVFYFFRIC